MNAVVRAGFAALGLLSLALCALPALAQDGDDTIRKTDKSTVTGKIKSEDLSGVNIEVQKGASITVGWSSIMEGGVTYAGSGAPEVRKAKVLIAEGKVEEAIALLEDALKKSDLRDVLKPHALNQLGAAYLQAGDPAKCIQTYNDLFKVAPKTQFLVSGGQTLINAYLAAGNAAGANDALKMLESGAKGTEGLALLKGRVQEANGDFAGAAATYGAVANSAKDQATKDEAELGVGRALWGQKKAGEAEAKFRSLVSRGASPLVLAGAWNGLGDVMYQAGVAKPDAEMITNALFDYLRGVVLYVPLGGEPTREHERAIRGAADCFKALSEIEKDPERKKSNALRARERMEYLKTKFPTSPYLK